MIDNIHCSKLSRAMACAGSLFFKDLPKEETSEQAAEGTAAGEYLERLLTKQPLHPEVTHARNGVAFDLDMRFFALDAAVEIRDKLGGTYQGVLCETQIDWTTRSGIKIKGRYDASFVHEGKLYIDDYKYGFGLVEVKENWQLLGYAIGEVIRRNEAFSEIVLRIKQPRAHHEDGTVREWKITYDELIAYKEQIETRMMAIANGENSLTSGPQCKYCPAAAACPAFNKAYHRGVDLVHQFVQDNMDESELSYQLDLMYRVEELLKTRKGSLELLAVSRIKEGKLIENYGVDNRYGNRTWRSGIDANVIKALTGKDIVKMEMLSPAQAEKVGVPIELIDTVTDRKFLGNKLKKLDSSKLADKIFGAPKGM